MHRTIDPEGQGGAADASPRARHRKPCRTKNTADTFRPTHGTSGMETFALAINKPTAHIVQVPGTMRRISRARALRREALRREEGPCLGTTRTHFTEGAHATQRHQPIGMRSLQNDHATTTCGHGHQALPSWCCLECPPVHFKPSSKTNHNIYNRAAKSKSGQTHHKTTMDKESPHCSTSLTPSLDPKYKLHIPRILL